MRVGIGYDSHRFTPGTYIRMGGIAIPHEKGIQAHSDGDVLLHALVDAVLGAAALGDLGSHFPDTDPRFSGMPSVEFVKHAMSLLKKHNWQLANMDATIVTQAPKLMHYIPQIRDNLSTILQLPVTQISVKAKTNEGMGWIGREEGLAAMVVVGIVKAEILG